MSSSQLAARYPNHLSFVIHWTLSTLSDLFPGYLVPQDAVELIRSAVASSVGT